MGTVFLAFGGRLSGAARFLDPFNSALAAQTQGQSQSPAAFGATQRLEEFQVQSAAEGSAIPRCFGPRSRVAGQLIWVGDLFEAAGQIQGVPFYEYYLDFAVGICEGPISKIKRVWANGKIFYEDGVTPILNSTDPVQYSLARRGGYVSFYPGDIDQAPDPFISAYNTARSRKTPGYGGLAYMFCYQLNLKDWGNQLPSFNFEVEAQPSSYPVATALSSLAAAADVTDLDTVDVSGTLRGLRLDQSGPVAEPMGSLMEAFDLVASGGSGTLRLLSRGQEDTWTLPPEDLGGIAPSSGDRAWGLRFEDPDDRALPRELTIRYVDEDEDLQRGSQQARRALPDLARGVSSLDMPVTLTAAEARAIGERLLARAWLERVRVRFTLPPSYLELEETDLISVDFEEVDYELRVVAITRGFDFSLEVEAVVVAMTPGAQLESPEAPASSGATPTQTPYTPPTLALFALDLPAILDVEATQVGYQAGVSTDDPADTFLGATLYQAPAAAGPYRLISPLADLLPTGEAVDALPAPPGGVVTRWDDVSTVDIDMLGGSLASLDRNAVLDGQNWALLGDEIIGFATATLIAANRYRLSGLLRGLRDTDDVIGEHDAGDLFILLDFAKLRYQPLATTDIGALRWFKAPAAGAFLQQVTAKDFTPRGRSLKPFRVGHVQGTRDSAGNLTITWIRRTRAPSRVFSQVPTPNLESIERYELDVMDGATVVRTIVVTDATTASYSAAQQTTDFGSAQPSIDLRIYQVSGLSTIGRGNVKEVTV